jgi:iron complex transport system substrate-binding protein
MLALWLAAVTLLAVACDRSSGSPTDTGGAASAPSPTSSVPASAPNEAERVPLRILSGAPSITEMLCALGLRERLVGRSRYCDYPPEVASVPVFGDLFDVDAERIVALQPSLVLISGRSRPQADRFTRLGLTIESLPDESLSDISSSIREIGRLCGVEAAAESLCRRIADELDALDARLRPGAPRRVLICLGTLPDPPRPPFVASVGSFYDDLLRRAGCRNAAPESMAAFAPLSLESVLAADPDVIIELAPTDATRPNGDVDAAAAWGRIGPLRAVAAGRVHVLVGGEYYIPGPRIAAIYAGLLSAIGGHPVGTQPAREP